MKKIGSTLIAMLLVITAMLPLTAHAAEVTMDLENCHVSWDYTLTDAEGNAFSAAYGLKAADDYFNGKGFNAYASKMHDYTAKRKNLSGDKSDWVYGQDYVYCFCIERGIPLPNNTEYAASGDTSFGNKYEQLSYSQKVLLSLALAYGYPNRRGLSTSADANACYSATQLIVWQITMGFRTSPTEVHDKTYPMSGYTGTMTEQFTANKYLRAYYDLILSDMANHYARPSFASALPSTAQTFEMEYVNGQYKLTLTDTNNVLDRFYVSVSDGASVSISGNTMTITSSTPITDATTIKLNRRMPTTTSTTGFLIWSVPGKESANQDMVSGVTADNDPVPSYLKIEAPAGNLALKKTSEDGVVANIPFTVTGNGVNKTVKTDASGEIYLENLRPGTYTVTEAAPEKYVQPQAQTVTIVSGKTATVEFDNILKKWTLTMTKVDKETGSTAQGDATLKGAEYGVYKDGVLQDSYFTDDNGQFTTKEYVCGSGWELREITPPKGYLLNENYTALGVSPSQYTAELNNIEKTDGDTVVKGTVSIIKHTDDGSTKVETPEIGAEFEVYLKSSGNFENAKESERDLLICDINGFAQTKELPFGVYIVKQTKGWEGRELIAPFEAEVTENGKDYKYLINNSNFESYVKIVKKDAETGKVIPAAGTEFKIFDPSGKQVSMTMTYPTVVTMDTFKTDSEGYLVTPQPLPYGKGYSVVEINAPEGYVLDTTPVFFDLTVDNATKDTAVTVVIVEKKDTAQKGTIEISKTGEVFSSVTEADGKYQPMYAVSGLSGAVFEIYADEDIITPDGTLRYAKDTLVDTVTTGADGKGVSTELYLGAYRVIETKAPFGTVIDKTPKSAVLTYAGQEVAVTSTSVSQNNDRQKVSISLSKVLEQDDKMGLGGATELAKVVFGLYADEDLTAADGAIIPKDGLIETVTCDENGSVSFKTDLPFGHYYIKEISTDEHYILSDSKYAFTFEYLGQEDAVVVIKPNGDDAIGNDFIRGSVTTTKVNADYPDNKLTGATFVVYRDTNGNKQYDADIDIFIGELTETETGVYTLEKLIYGGCFLYEQTAPEGFVKDNEYHYFEIIKDGEIVEVSNNGGEGFANKPIKGNVTTTKVDAKYPDHKLSGAVFEIYSDVDGDGKYTEGMDILVGEMTETETGIYTMPNLGYGKYLLHEKSAPSGFVQDKGYYAFSITEDGVTVSVENKAGVGFINQPVPENPHSPQTGDTSNMGFWIGLAGVALGGLIAMLIIRRKSRKDDDDE